MRIFDLWFICIGASIYCALCLCADIFWLAELAVHWRLHAACGAVFFALIFLWKQPKKSPAIFMLLMAILLGSPAINAFTHATKPSGVANAKLKILQFNVLYENTSMADATAWIIAQDADIVVLQEIDAARAAELGPLKKYYPWSRVQLNKKNNAFGMAIFSKHPAKAFSYTPTEDGWNHYSMTELNVAGTKLHLYELHTPPPMSAEIAAMRNAEMALMGKVLIDDKTPYKLLLGDMNNTVYSPYFTAILANAQLHNAQQGYQMEGTWPSFFPMPLRIGIDHLAASNNIEIQQRVVGPYLGSDHLPIVTQLAFYKP